MKLANALLIALGLIGLHSTASATKSEDLVKSIRSVAEVKIRLQKTLRGLDRCGVGSCVKEYSIQVCDLLGALDLKLGGNIVDPAYSYRSELEVNRSELVLLKGMYRYCKPTNYQYWNDDPMLRVSYQPPKKVAPFLERLLNESISNTGRGGEDSEPMNLSSMVPHALIQIKGKQAIYIDYFFDEKSCLLGASVLVRLGKKMNPNQPSILSCAPTE